jgi:hypothetical protein
VVELVQVVAVVQVLRVAPVEVVSVEQVVLVSHLQFLDLVFSMPAVVVVQEQTPVLLAVQVATVRLTQDN